MSGKTVLIGLNEINFDFLEFYFAQGKLPNFKALFANNRRIETVSESEYHLLEPWIQWVTIHTGKSYAEHQIFRLGDIADNLQLSQIFEELEAEGNTIGAISPFNAANKLKNASFFVPDPWTKTKVSGSNFITKLYKAIHQAVNDNAQEKISISSLITLVKALLFYTPVSSWTTYLSLFLSRKQPGTKAMILDSLLADVFIKLWKKHQPDFSNLFLNSGAHIQHHYMFNSAAYQGSLKNPDWYCPQGYDPFIKVMSIYDKIIGRLLSYKDVKLLVATGLHQHPHEQLTYYYRINEHERFLKAIGITEFTEVQPRMSRDFLILFDNQAQAASAASRLEALSCKQDNELIFDVDNRGTSLFIELIYPNEAVEGMTLIAEDYGIIHSDFDKEISFVAIKNGEHNGIGYLISNVELSIPDSIPLTQVKEIIKGVVAG